MIMVDNTNKNENMMFLVFISKKFTSYLLKHLLVMATFVRLLAVLQLLNPVIFCREFIDVSTLDYISKIGYEWKQQHYPNQLLTPQERRDKSDKLISEFRATISGGIFTNNTVLQREPELAALYGTSDTPNVAITVNIKQEDGNFVDTLHATTDAMTNDWKVLLNKPMPNGGNYTITIECPQCKNPNDMDGLYNVTFGDVYYCAGT